MPTVASIGVDVILNHQKYVTGLTAVTQSTRSWAQRLQGIVDTAFGVGLARALEALSRQVVKFGASIVQTAIDFESAFAGVTKTVDGTRDAFGNLTEFGQQLFQELRGLATEIPVAFEELASIAELGGQLGVAGEDITAFTKTIAQLAVTTNLTAEEAATAFAQLGNVMGSSQDDLTRLASAVVALGNNMATTERDIVNFAQRIAGAATIAGLSEAAVVGIAAAFSSVGVQAEAGGTAVQKVLLGINTAVVTGSADLAKFAAAAGMSAEEFAAAWESDAGAAFTAFVEGLGAAGDEAILILQELGLEDQRLIRSFLSLASAGDLLEQAISIANNAFRQNTALMEEAQQRFATTESKIQLLKNVFRDLGFVIGNAVLPFVNQAIDGLIEIGLAVTNFAAKLQSGVPLMEALAETLQGLGVPPHVIASIQTVVGFLVELGQAIGHVVQVVRTEGLVALFAVFEDGSTHLGRFLELFGATEAQADAVAGAINRVVQPLVAAVANFQHWREVLLGVGVALGGFLVVSKLVSLFTSLAGVVASAAAAFTAAGGGIAGLVALLGGPVTVAVAGVAAAVAGLAIAWKTNFAQIQETAEGLRLAVGQIGEAFRSLLQGDINGFVTGVQEAVRTGFEALSQFAGNVARIVLTALGDLARQAMAFIQSVDWLGLGRSITEAIQVGLQVAGQLGAATWQWLVQSLTDFIGSVDWPALGRSVVEAVRAGLVAVAGVSADVWAWLLTSLTDFVNGVDWGSVGGFIVDALVAGLVGLGAAVAGLAYLLVEGLETWFDAAAEFAGGADWIQIGVDLATAIVEGLGEFVDGAADALAEWGDVFLDWAGAEDWGEVAEMILEGIGDALGDAASSIGDYLSDWNQEFLDWAGAEDWGEVAVIIIEGIAEGLADFVGLAGDALQGWEDAFWDWVGDVDWVDLGLEIIELIAEGLEDFGGAVDSALDGWADAFFDWVGSVNWAEIGTTAVGLIVEGFATFTQLIGNVVAGWLSAFTAWVNGVDWYQVGFTAVTLIITGFLSFVQRIQGSLSVWVTAIGSWARSVDWKTVGLTVVLGVLLGLTEFVSRVAATLSGWVTAIRGFFASRQGEWGSIGRDIVGGIAEGIRGAAAAIANAAADVVRGAVAAARAAVGARSPATALIPVGFSMGEGVAVGMQQSTGVVAAAAAGMAGSVVTSFQGAAGQITQALAQITGDISTEGLQGMAEAVAAIGAAVGPAIDGLMDLAGFNSIDGVLQSAVEFNHQLQQLIWVFADAAAEFKTKGVEKLQKFLSAVRDAAELVQPTIDALNELKGFQAIAGIEPHIRALAHHIQQIVSIFGQAAETLDKGLLKHVQLFTETAGKVADLIEPAIEALQALAQFEAVQDLVTPLVAFTVQVALMVAAMSTAATLFSTHMLAKTQEFAEAAAAVADLVEPAIESIHALARFGDAGPIVTQLEAFRLQIEQIVAALAAVAATFDSDLLAQVEAFAAAAGTVVELIGPAIEAIHELGRHRGIAGVVHGMLAFANQLTTLVSMLVYVANQFSGPALDHAQLFAAAANDLVGIVAGAMAAIQELDGFFRIPGLVFSILAFRADMMLLMSNLVFIADQYSGPMLDHAQKFAEATGELLGIIEAALNSLTLLTGFIRIPGLVFDILAFRADLMILMSNLLFIADQYSGPVLDHAQRFADAAGALLGIIEEGIAGIQAVVGYVAAVGLATAVATFAADLITVLTALVTAFEQSGLLAGDAADQAGEFASKAKSLLGLVTEGIEAIQAVVDYVAATGIEAAAAAFAADLVAVVDALWLALRDSALALDSASDAAGDLAKAADALLGLVAEGVEAIAAVVGYVAASNLKASVAAFANDLVAVVDAIFVALNGSALALSGAAEAAGELAKSAETLLGLVGEGVDAIAALVGYVASTTIAADAAAFATDLIAVVDAVYIALRDSALALDNASGAAGDLAKAAEALLGLVVEGIDAVTAVTGYVAAVDIAGAADAFAADLIAVVDAVYVALRDSALALDSAGTAAQDLADTAETLLGLVGEGVDAIEALVGYVASVGLVGAVEAFAADFITLIETFVAAIVDSGLLLDGAVTAVGGVADQLKEIADLVEPALEAVVGLQEFTSSGDVLGKAEAFAADFITIVQAILDGIEQSGLLASQILVEAEDLLSAMEAVVDIVEPAIDAVVALISFESVPDIGDRADQFAVDLVAIIEAIANGLQEAGLLANAAVAEAGEMAGDIEAILDVVEPALDPDKGAIALIANFTVSGDLQGKTEQFVAALLAITQVLVDGLTQSALASDLALQKAGEMAKSIEDLLKIIEPALDAIAGLAEFSSSGDIIGKAQAFTDDLVGIAQTLVDGLTAAANSIGATAVAQAQGFAEAVLAVADAMRGALAAINEMADLERPDITDVAAFIVEQAELVAHIFTQAQAVLNDTVLGAAQAFIDRVQQIVVIVQGVLATISGLVVGSGSTLGDLLNQMVQAILSFEPDMAGAGVALGEAFGQALLDTIRGFIEAVLDEVARLNDIATTGEQAMADFLGAIERGAAQAQTAFDQMTAGAIAAVDELAQGTKSAMEKLAQEMARLGQQAGEALGNSVASGAAEATAAIDEMARAATAAVNNMVNQMDQAGRNVGQALADGITSGAAQAQTAVDNMVSKTLGAIQGLVGQMGSLGQQAGQALGQGLSSSVGVALSKLGQQVNQAMGSMSSGIAAAVSGANNQLNQLAKSGANAMDSLANELSNSQALTNAVNNSMQQTVNAANTALGIASPSKVFERMGLNSKLSFLSGLGDLGIGQLVQHIQQAVAALPALPADGLAGLTQSIRAATAEVRVGPPAAPRVAAQRPAQRQQTVTNNHYYQIHSPIPISEEGDVVDNIRALRLQYG